ncbi:MAG: hypothetical protein ACTSQJ_00730 [Promethearchaeota archaeon]
MTINKRYLLILGFLFFSLIITALIYNNLYQTKIKKSIEDKDYNEKSETIIIPKSSDSKTFYKSNPFLIVNDPFNDYNDWSMSTIGGGSYSIDTELLNDYLHMEADNNPGSETVLATYDVSLPRFIHGAVNFDYRIGGSNIVLYFRITENGVTYQTVWSASSSSGWDNTGWIDISNYDTNNANFNFRIEIVGQSSGDYSDIDDFQLGNYEFCWLETVGEQIVPNINQFITVFINPDFNNFNQNNVTLKYNINNPSLTYGYTITSTQSSNNFTFSIPETNYHAGDTIYYKIIINDNSQTVFHSSTKVNFACCSDNENPTIQNFGGNYTGLIYYYEDILITCDISDNYELKSVMMYIANDSIPNFNDVHIHSINASVPEDGGNFHFIIPSKSISARKQLRFVINATDYSGRTTISNFQSINILDNIAPSISFIGDNSLGGIIDCNDSLVVQYKITEPKAGAGLLNAFLCVKIGKKDPPKNGTDILANIPPDGGINNPDGGILSFTIPTNYYKFNETIYYFVNATDVSSNMKSTFPIIRKVNITDNTFPNVIHDSSNGLGCSYHINKTLSFTILEPLGGSGIDNDSLVLYYQLNDNALSSPKMDYLSIPKFGGVINFIIDDINYAFGDIVYYRLNVSDINGNLYSSTILNFTIIDLVVPNYTEGDYNTNGWMYTNYKILNFTIWDPDYDGLNLSSGMSSIYLYFYASKNIPSISDVINFGNKKALVGLIKNQSTYNFNITLNDTLLESGPKVFYVINITDVAGNSLISSSLNYFIIYKSAYIGNSFNVPESVIGSSIFEISFDLNFYCDVWYSIDGIDYYNLRIAFIKSFYKEFNLKEGKHEIIFYMAKNLSTYTISIEIDLTPPEVVSDIGFEIYGFDIVEIYWNAPDGADSETIYRLYRSTEKDFEINEDTLIAEIEVGEPLSYEDSDIKPGETYYYKIIAIDRVGNISEVSAAVEVKIPQNPLFMIILLIIIGSISGFVVFIARKKIIDKKREEIFSKVDLKDLNIDDEFEEKTHESPKWTAIPTKAISKPIEKESGFEFLGDSEVIDIKSYWKKEISTLLGKALDYELKNEYGKALFIYNILIRLSKRLEILSLTMRLEGKKNDIYNISS